ncbi:hypothetical protein B0T13DRAFT_457343 [Neurospora crassa]|nr:hypothetical protein B0T13DRAFT_457343 [Neurospora crassa]
MPIATGSSLTLFLPILLLLHRGTHHFVNALLAFRPPFMIPWMRFLHTCPWVWGEGAIPWWPFPRLSRLSFVQGPARKQEGISKRNGDQS